MKILIFFLHKLKRLCYNRVMVRNTLKLKTLGGLAAVAAVLASSAFIINYNPSDASATATCTTTTTTKSCTDSSTFQVNVGEILTVKVTEPTSWASGDLTYDNPSSKYVSGLLTNVVSLAVQSNNNAGFQATMVTNETSANSGTDLVNEDDNTQKISTLSTATSTSAFPANAWGWGKTTAIGGTAPTTYNPLKASNETPSVLLSATSGESGGTDIYFGAKANNDKASGTYARTVVISVVSGVHDDTAPTTPTNPTDPSDAPTTPGTTGGNSNSGTTTSGGTSYDYTTNYAYNSGATGGASGNAGTTIYNNTYTQSSNPTTTTTYSEVSAGNNTSNYSSSYKAPLGETETTVASVNEGTPVAAGIAAAAGVAAVAGAAFFAVAHRNAKLSADDYDDDEEDY